MKKAIWLLALTGGCIEYTPSSTLPPAGIANAKPLEPSSTTDKLVQVTTPEVDILWVIDNSCSMYEEQSALGSNFPAFMNFFLDSGLDYHIGMTSTDYGALQGRLVNIGGERWITPQSPNPTVAFGTAAVMGTNGSATEKGRDPTFSALEIMTQPGAYNEGFVRENATLHMVTISDENDYSNLITRAEFIDYLLNLKVDPDNVTYSAIVTPSNYPGYCYGGIEPGTEYLAVQQAVGGIMWPICNPDWTELLIQLGMQAAGLKREYFLSELPVPGTIQVWVKEDGTRLNFEEGTDWSYNQVRNSILFNEFVPTALSEVYVKYDLLGESDHI